MTDTVGPPSSGTPVVTASGAPAQQTATPFWLSKTFYGAALTFLLPIIGPPIKAKFHLDIDSDVLADYFVQIATAASFVWTLYGRAKATGPLTVTKIQNTPVVPKE